MVYSIESNDCLLVCKNYMRMVISDILLLKSVANTHRIVASEYQNLKFNFHCHTHRHCDCLVTNSIENYNFKFSQARYIISQLIPFNSQNYLFEEL